MSSAASYHNTIRQEAAYLAGLDSTATEDKFHGLYNGILNTWFPASRGYIIDTQLLGVGGKPEFIAVRHAGGHRNPLLIVELKRPSKWNNAGKQEVVSDLTEYIEGRFDLTLYKTIYGVGGIGLHWMACKMEKSGSDTPTTVLGWQDDVSSNRSYNAFKTLADLVYNIQ
jgi:hypothetical protein